MIMRKNYRILPIGSCANCAYSEDFGYGERRCYKYPARSKSDSREVHDNAVCDDFLLWKFDTVLSKVTVPIDDPNKQMYSCEVIVVEF